jgi:hypothetical protein
LLSLCTSLKGLEFCCCREDDGWVGKEEKEGYGELIKECGEELIKDG